LNREEFSAMAFPRSSLSSSISTTNECLTGMSKAYTRPRKRVSTKRCQIWTDPVRVRTARTRACSMARTWVAMRRWYRFMRSA